MKLLHVGICVHPKPYNGFQQAFIDEIGEENYREIFCGEPDLNKKIINIFNSFNPDIVFMQIQSEGAISLETMKYISKVKVINWTGDIRVDTPRWMQEIAPYCISSFSNMKDVRFMLEGGFRSEYLEIGYDQSIYTPIGETATCPDIVFMGNNYGTSFPLSSFRYAMVKRLKQEFGVNFGVYGNGWSGGNGNLNHSQKEEAKYYRGAKIAINCSHFKEERYSSDRLLRILGTGCFCISHRFPKMDYVDGKDLVTFDNLDELVVKIKYYICHENERNKIADEGRELVLGRNTFKHQVQNIITL